MAPRITPEFYWSEEKRLLRLAATTIDGVARQNLLALALRYHQMAIDLQAKREEAANTGERDPT